jgi:transposase
MQPLSTDHMVITDVRHMPIVKNYARKIGLVETIDRMVDTQMELSPGYAVLGMVLDTLSGRTPLYRLTEFFEEKDTELLLGAAIEPERFCDTNLGRSMDKIFETGTQKIFSQLAQNALTVFEVDPRRLHFDTTSVSVFGDYDLVDPPFDITYGYSKDKRPDLKQFLVSMLCVERNIPILGTTTDGNASDKSLNNELLTNISKHMARHGLQPGAYVYVADSAFVTEDNLKKADDRQTWFLTRLPATYNECSRVIRDTVARDEWIEIGTLAEERDRPKRPIARYRAWDSTVSLYGRSYRAIVVHSSAHDKRRHKRIDRMLKKDRKQLEAGVKEATATGYYCRKDAETAGEKLIRKSNSSYHRLQIGVEKVPKYGRGRPAAGKPRKILRYEYLLTAAISEAPEKVHLLREEAGCFVLLTNLDQPTKWSVGELLSLYKSQIGIEKNFSFLKDPAIVNSIFLKRAERIEVLGLVLLISLLIWRLMERSMRQYIETNDCTLPGWVRRKTKKPTAFMMTTKFASVMVITVDQQRQLAKPLKPFQQEYLQALGVPIDAFTVP